MSARCVSLPVLAFALALCGCGDDSSGTVDTGPGVDAGDMGAARRAEACRIFSAGPTASVTAGDLDDRAVFVAPGTRTTVTFVPGRGVPNNVGWLDFADVDAEALHLFLSVDEVPALFRVLTQLGPTNEQTPLSGCPEVARYMEYRSIDPSTFYKLAFQSTDLDTIDVLYLIGD